MFLNAMEDFQIRDEYGFIHTVTFISDVVIDNVRYGIYKLINEDGSVSILSSYLDRDDNGLCKLRDINNEEDKNKIKNYIEQLNHDGGYYNG